MGWEDVSLKPMPPDSSAQFIVGEHLRVFRSECIWSYSRLCCITYSDAQREIEKIHPLEFVRLFNASTFEAAITRRNVVVNTTGERWQVVTESGALNSYDDEANEIIEQARR